MKIEELAASLKKDYTIVIVTHNMQQAVRISDYTAFFLLGELVEFGGTEQIFSQPLDKRTEDYITGGFGNAELFEEQLLLLNQELTEMGSQCEEIISCHPGAGFHTKGLGEKVSKVGAKIDEEERTIETICMRLLLRQQPVARDLRAVSAALKMITDMERIGDQAEDIVEIIPCMIAHPHEEYPKIREMAKETIAMVTDSVDALTSSRTYIS